MAAETPSHILIIDDDVAQARLVQRMLTRAGYVVDLAHDGDAGLARCATESYDVLLVDHQMPGKGGLEVLRTLVAQGTYPPTVMLTGHGDEDVAVEAMKLGAGDYIVKDVEGRYLALLPAVLERVLQQQRLIDAKQRAEDALHETLETLERRVQERTAELQRADRLALVGQLASGLAHEIGTPLNIIGGNAELLRMQLQAQQVPTTELDAIIEHVDRITGLVEQLLTFARARPQGMVSLSLYDCTTNVLRLLEARWQREGITVVLALPPALPPVWGAPEQIEQVLLNVLVNAWHAMPQGGSMTITATPMDDTWVRLTCCDSGSGIAPEDLGRIFEPFYSTKGERGTGLGLAICRQIIDNHKGTIRVDSTLGEGTTVTIDLRRADTLKRGPVPQR